MLQLWDSFNTLGITFKSLDGFSSFKKVDWREFSQKSSQIVKHELILFLPFFGVNNTFHTALPPHRPAPQTCVKQILFKLLLCLTPPWDITMLPNAASLLHSMWCRHFMLLARLLFFYCTVYSFWLNSLPTFYIENCFWLYKYIN